MSKVDVNIAACAEHKQRLLDAIKNKTVIHSFRRDKNKNLLKSGLVDADYVIKVIRRANKDNYMKTTYYDKEGKPKKEVHIFKLINFKNDDWYFKWEYKNKNTSRCP